jgi:putative ABC transport system ATP-binding protein
MEPLLEIRGLGFRYEGMAAPVFENLDLVAGAGEFILVKGASGTGKSTLLRLICRLNRPQSGAILFRGKPLTDMTPSLLRSHISYVAQIPQMADMSIGENLLLPFSFLANRTKTPPSNEMLERMLAQFYLEGTGLGQSALKLSTGQKQRLAIMRSILLQPDLMLLDEPTSALDPESASMVFSIMERLNAERNMTIITVTHSDYLPKSVRKVLFMLQNRQLNRITDL